MPDVELQNPLIIPFNRGLNTKDDPKVVQTPYLLVCENGILQEGTTIEPRPGFVSLPTRTDQGGHITNGAGTLAYNNELLVFDDQQLYSWSPATQQWVVKGPANSVQTATQNVITNSYQQTQSDWAINGNIAVYVWNDSRGGVRASVVDIETGVYLQSDVLIQSNGLAPRCISIGNNIFVGYGDGAGGLFVSMLATGAPQAFQTPKLLATDMADSGVFDWCLTTEDHGNSVVAILYAQGTGTAVLCYMTPTGYLGSPGNGFSNPPATLTIQGDADLCAIVSVNSYLYCFTWSSSQASITNNIYDPSLAAFAMGFYGTGTLSGWTNLVAYHDPLGPSAANLFVYYEVPNASITDQNGSVSSIGYPLLNVNPGQPPTIFKAGLGLGSKPFVWQDLWYLVLTYGSPLQSTFFVVGVNGLVVSRHLYGQGSGALPGPAVPQVLSPTTGTFAWPGLKQGQLESQNGAVFTPTGVSLESVNFTAPARYQGVLLGQEIHIAGGLVQSYDSANLVEHGFLISPETITVVATPTTGGNIAAGVYQITYILEWTDNKGQIHRSAGANPVTVTITSGSGTSSIELAVPPLRLTSKGGVVVSFFRTTDTGSVFFKSSNVLAPIINDPTQASQTFVDTLSDADLENNEILYTVGGELDNDPPPAASLVAVGKQRIWLAGTEDPNVLYFSKQAVTGQGVSFSLALSMTFDTIGGPINAIAIMDDKVIVWKRDLVYFFNGDGPNALGQNNSFTLPQIIASDVGCINQASVVLDSEGLYFMSDKGIYLLSRSLQLTYVGAPAENFNDQNVTSAILMPKVNQIRFGTDQARGRSLVYNYFYQEAFSNQLPEEGQWSTFTNHVQKGACLWMGQYCFLTPGGRLCVEQPGLTTDNGAAIVMRIRTSWIVARLLGFMNVPELALLGNYLGTPHLLRMAMAYDFQPYDSQVVFFDTRTGIPLDAWGDDATWGESPTWGGFGDSSYQFRCRIPQQQCSSVQFEFSNVVPAGVTPGACYSINALAVLMELQEGLARLPTIRSV